MRVSNSGETEFLTFFSDKSGDGENNHSVMTIVPGYTRLSNKRGYIYCLAADSPRGIYKIGRTNDPYSRAETLGILLPFEVSTVNVIGCNDVILVEKYWHKRFATSRLNGEWFRLSREQLDEFTAVDTVLWMDESQLYDFEKIGCKKIMRIA